MAKLNSPLQEQVESVMDKSNQAFDKENYIESIKLLIDAWELLPQPKGIYDESFHIVLYITEIYLLIGKVNKAKEWSERIYECDLERIDNGQREFLNGKVAFEAGELDKAKELFSIANQKSEGRCFKKGDEKYLKFFKKK